MRGLRWILGFFVFTFTLCVVLAVGGALWAQQDFQSPGPLTQETLFEITPGSGLRAISFDLSERGIIRNPYVFMVAAKIMQAEDELKAGEYEFETASSAAHVLQKIRAHDVFRRFVTIPEGKTSYEIVEILKSVADLTGTIAPIPEEGSLLPETYDYTRGEDRQAVIARMQNAMKGALESACKTASCEGGTIFKSPKDVLILASIIEKETGKPEERRTVAGVFVNRLEQNMALQTDPSVIYALTGGKPQSDGQGPLGRRLLKKDLEFDSPYNTYLYPGLPPGPIANPGKASIEAALNPENHDYLYFVADGSGGHLFAKTLDEHNANVAHWRKIRNQTDE